MKRLSLNAWNDWKWVGRYSVDVTLLRANVDFLRGHFISADVMLLGFGASLTYYFNPASTKWTAWEPIETNGWAGEPQGMEKAP
jgi:hypothetical protein